MSSENKTSGEKTFENKSDRLRIGKMTSSAIRDYFYSFRWGNILTNDNFYLVFTFSILPIVYSARLFEEEQALGGMRMWMVLCGVISMTTALIGTRINPLPFSKIVYLCPMNRKQRKEYTETMFWVRIIFPMLLFVVGRMILWIAAPINIFYLVIDFMLILAMLGIAMAISSTNLYGLNPQISNQVTYGESSPLVVEVMFEQRFKKKTPINEAANKGVLSMLIGYFTYFFAMGFGDYRLQNDTMTKILCTGAVLLLVFQVYLTYKMYSKLDDYIQYACRYEGE